MLQCGPMIKTSTVGLTILVLIIASAIRTAGQEPASASVGPADTLVYVGTYTGGKSNSQGIYAFKMARGSTALVPLGLSDRDREPVVHRDRCRPRTSLCGQRGRRVQRQANRLGQRLLDRSAQDRQADADQPAANPGQGAVSPGARQERAGAGGRQLHQRHRDDAAGGGGRPSGRADGGDPAHRQQRQREAPSPDRTPTAPRSIPRIDCCSRATSASTK